MRLVVLDGDIAAQDVDVVVNAANSSLLGGGGVDGAIHAAAGPQLLAECRKLRRSRLPDGLPAGQAVATGAGRLAARWVIHTVGPNRHRGQTETTQLASCFIESLRLAGELGGRSVAFPAVGAGAYGWAVGEVAEIAVAAVREAVASGQTGSVEEVRFVAFGAAARQAFERAVSAEPPPATPR